MGLTSHPVAVERQEEGKQIRDKDMQAIVYHLDPLSQYRDLARAKHEVKQHKKRVAKGVRKSQNLQRAAILQGEAPRGATHLDKLFSDYALEHLRDNTGGVTFFSCAFGVDCVEMKRAYQPRAAQLFSDVPSVLTDSP